jgi:hypothetical protein
METKRSQYHGIRDSYAEYSKQGLSHWDDFYFVAQQQTGLKIQNVKTTS